MVDLVGAVDRAKGSLYFSGARIAEDLERFLGEQGEGCVERGREAAGAVEGVVLVGSGGSWASLLTAKYLLDGMVAVPVEALASYELIWREPVRVGPGTLAVVATYSGETEDTVKALRYAKERGARTLAIVGVAGSTAAREADDAIVYGSGAIFEVPVAVLALMGVGMADPGRGEAAAGVRRGLEALPGLLRPALATEEGRAEARAREFLPAHHLYVLGAGPLAPLAYKVALTVVMENIRIGATFCDASEFRHGPAEALERVSPWMMFLVGTDASRETTLRTIEFCRGQGANALVYDAAEVGPELHPLLSPLLLNSFTQWFTVYSAILRGIADLDERVFMGHQVLTSDGSAWP